MPLTSRSRTFLIALAAIIGVIFAADAWRTGRPEDVTPPPVAPPVEARPEARRGTDQAPLLHASEFLRAALARLSPSIVHAVPSSGPSSRGYVFDATHVMVALTSGAERWNVRFGDGARAAATLVASDPVHGVGVLALTGDARPPLALATTREVRTAEPVIVVAPGPDIAAARTVQWPGDLREIRRDAAPSPPSLVFSLDGELLAMHVGPGAETATLSAAQLLEIGEALVTTGRHAHPWIGAELQDIDGSLRRVFPEGAILVSHVYPGSPAAGAGLREGSTWAAFEIGDRQARRASDVEALLAGFDPVRAVPPPEGGEPLVIEVIDRQWSPQPATGLARRGIVPEAPEVRISVVPGTAAATAGLRDGDVVVALDGRAVASQAVLARALADPRAHLVKVRREGRHWLLALPPADAERDGRSGAPASRAGGAR
jgi:serine protease DegQ